MPTLIKQVLILAVLHVCMPESHSRVYKNQSTLHVTDGEMKRHNNRTDEITVFRPNNTQKVSYDWSRLVKDLASIQVEPVRRRRRQAGGMDIYQQLAASSGGTVFMTDKGSIGSVIDIIKETFTASPVSLMSFRFPTGSSSFVIPVDETLTAVSIKIQTQRGAPSTPVVTKPSGTETFTGPEYTKKALGRQMMVYKLNTIKTTDFGDWNFKRSGGKDWEVIVSGQSKLDFSYQMMEAGPGGLGTYPVKGRPIAGQQVKISVDVPYYNLVQTVSKVLFLDDKGGSLGEALLTNLGGRRGKSKFITAFTVIPITGFKLALEGIDKHGHRFVRLDPPTVTPLNIQLDVPFHRGTLHVTESVDIPYNVTNTGTRPLDVKIQIIDSEMFAQSPTAVTKTIAPGASVINKFVITAGNVVGVTTTMTVTATVTTSSTGQYEVRRLTVVEKEKSTTTTTTTLPPTTPSTTKQTLPTTSTAATALPTTTLSTTVTPPPTTTTTAASSSRVSAAPVADNSVLSTKMIVFGTIVALIGCLVPLATMLIVLKLQGNLMQSRTRSQELDIQQTIQRRNKVTALNF